MTVLQMLLALAWWRELNAAELTKLPVEDVDYRAWCDTVWKTVHWRPSSLWTATSHWQGMIIGESHFGIQHFISNMLSYCSYSPAMPLGWPHTNGCVTHGGPGRMLLREMLWQLEQRALQVQNQYCISRGILGYRHAPAYPSLLALIPASEHRQLERLCGRIPPSHTAIVLSR